MRPNATQTVPCSANMGHIDTYINGVLQPEEEAWPVKITLGKIKKTGKRKAKNE
jgi:hypothetical protein